MNLIVGISISFQNFIHYIIMNLPTIMKYIELCRFI